MGVPPQRDQTHSLPLSPVPSPQPSGLCSLTHSRGLGPTRGRQASKGPLAALHGALILGKSCSGKRGTSAWTRWWIQGRTLKVRLSGLQGPWPLNNLGTAMGWGMGPRLGLASGFTQRFLVFPRLESLPHTFPVAHPSVHHLHCSFPVFLLYTDPV